MTLGIVTALLVAAAPPAAFQDEPVRIRVDVDRLTAQAHRIARAAPRIAASATAAAAATSGSLAQAVTEITMAGLGGLVDLALTFDGIEVGDLDFDGLELEAPPPSRDLQDPADSLYREGRAALNRGNYTRAAYYFSRIHEGYPRSSHAPDSYYWEAVAHYRSGSLAAAREALETQRDEHPRARTRGDARDLLTRVNAQLARRGDEEAAEDISRRATGVSRPPRVSVRAPVRVAVGRRGSCDDDDDDRVAALNALLQMDADRALPILRKVMANREEGSACLRRKAVFLISQHEGDESEAMLLDAVRSDPDQEVREQAVFWLGQTGGEHAAEALDSILATSRDVAVQEKAIFALSQNSSPKALQSLRDYAMKTTAPVNLRENAVFWLGQSNRRENVEFLKSVYRTAKEESLKEKIIFSIAQGHGREAQQWLTGVAADGNEDTEMRKKAIFWLSQSGGASLPELFSLYDRVDEREIREGLIFAYSQRHERAAFDKLVEIARNENDRELRKKALFWIGQSKDPRRAEILESIINRP